MLGRLFDSFVYLLIRAVCRIDAKELDKVPRAGPLLMIFNHINFLEAPLFYLFMRPRRIFGVMKVEISRVPIVKGIVRRWGGIPLKRGAPPSAAFRKVGELLAEGAIIGLAPEGTRSRDGHLQKGNPGVVTLAVQNDAPILPVAHYGSQNLWKNLRRFKRTEIRFKVGTPFKLAAPERVNKESRRLLTDQMMKQLAMLLPQELRGDYSRMDEIGEDLIVMLD
ncbi:lysophospholipid acyltransferase family protein [Marispirochaeta sp.]|jgi:1-acyl-sn-glycerol-3-phosphate acyltransferase|uniref:lysophospholipid acyltransferase family protein n=1 Tax=Marispirochaeta sp. TaxID=2038653 RepID=UPI0029C6150C|nr:lysophospholipid acyltransferase family protein [Marispirochaeta sp.]